MNPAILIFTSGMVVSGSGVDFGFGAGLSVMMVLACSLLLKIGRVACARSRRVSPDTWKVYSVVARAICSGKYLFFRNLGINEMW